jgi:SAM-dependent methyltransferase
MPHSDHKFEYIEFDSGGENTLKVISQSERFNRWMFSQLKPFVNGRILEIGSGIGNISKFLADSNVNFQMSDIRDQYIDYLKSKFPENSTLKIDLVHPEFEFAYKDLLSSYDLVFALNVLEHIENDSLALQNMQRLLKPGGQLFILVPAYNNLYNALDLALQHYRRYTISSLTKICPENMAVVKSWHFNSGGILGWFLVGRILKKELIPEKSMRIYNFLTPIFKLLDLITFRKIGLSVICLFKKGLQ